jgi:hypothetical protein
MSRERWGTFSVRDHMTDAPYVSDVLLYDRLVVPVPDANDHSAETQNYWAQWQPEEQAKCLEILKVKTDEEDGLALTVPWGSSQRGRFQNRMSTAVALASQQRDPGANYYIDPFEMTAELLKDEFSPALPKGVAKAWKVAAYGSAHAFEDDIRSIRPGTRRRLAAKIRTRFLTPAERDPDHEILKRAVDLVNTDAFRRKRSAFYAWQENIIEENIEDDKAIEELNQLLSAYNSATKKGFRTVKERFVFTILPVSLSLTGSILSHSSVPIILGAASAAVQLVRFCRFDRKPSISSGDFDAAAIIHDARKKLPLEDIFDSKD